MINCCIVYFNDLYRFDSFIHSFVALCVYLCFLAWFLFEQNFERLCNFLMQSFGSFVLRERQNHKVRVEITSYINQVAAVGPNGALVQTPFGPNEVPVPRNLSAIFGIIEKSKAAIGIQEYSVSQTTLEQIFNQFAAQVGFNNMLLFVTVYL